MQHLEVSCAVRRFFKSLGYKGLISGAVLLEKLTGSQLVTKFSAFYGTRSFITAFTSARHLSLSWARYIQSMAPPPTNFIKPHQHIILPSSLGSSKWSFSPRFQHQNPVYTTPLPIRATCLAHLFLLDLITRTILGEEYRSFSSPLLSLSTLLLPRPL